MSIVPLVPRIHPVLELVLIVPVLKLSPPMILSIHHRERGLIEALADIQQDVKTALVDPRLFEYIKGITWIAKRKCAKDLTRDAPSEVHFHPHVNITVDDTKLKYERYKNSEPSAKLLLVIFEA